MTVELQSQSVAAEEHTREQEQQQGGDAEAIPPLADDYAGEDKYCAKKENVFWCKRHTL